MWDLLTLQDTVNKGLEDKAYIKEQHELKLKMREMYLG